MHFDARTANKTKASHKTQRSIAAFAVLPSGKKANYL